MNKTRLGLGACAAALAIIVALLSTVTIETGERGVVERFGRATRDLRPGLHITLPWPIETVRRADVDRSLQMPIGFRLIDEIQGIEPTEREKQWLTSDTNIVELKAVVLYRVSDVRAWLYGVSGVATPGEGGMEGRSFALRRLGESTLTDIVAELTIDEVLSGGLALVPTEARTRIQDGADRLGLGVVVDEVQLLERKPPLSVRSAFTDVQEALSEKETAITRATFDAERLMANKRTEAQRILQEATSERDRRLAEARGRASAFADLAEAVGAVDSPAARKLYFDAIQQILQNAELRVVSGTAEEPARVFVD